MIRVTLNSITSDIASDVAFRVNGSRWFITDDPCTSYGTVEAIQHMLLLEHRQCRDEQFTEMLAALAADARNESGDYLCALCGLRNHTLRAIGSDALDSKMFACVKCLCDTLLRHQHIDHN